MGFDGGIEYGITLAYARTRNWGEWEIFREFMQNALDEMHEVTRLPPMEYPCRPVRGDAVIEDNGRGLAIYHLLIGSSEKKPWQRGKFGEGMKIALLAGVDKGIDISIYSKDKSVKPTSVEKVLEDKMFPVLCVCYKKTPEQIGGTRVIIHGKAYLCDAYRRNFTQGLDPSCIKYSHISVSEGSYEWRQLIDKRCTGNDGWIYVRDIYVTTFNDALGMSSFYSYNLFNVEIDESRRIPSGGSVSTEVERIWRSIEENAGKQRVERDLLKELLRNVINVCAGYGAVHNVENVTPNRMEPTPVEVETDVFSSRYGEVINDVFNELYEPDVAVIASEDDHIKATYLGIKHVYCPLHVGWSLEHILHSGARIRKAIEESTGKDVTVKMSPIIRALVDLLEDFAMKAFRKHYTEKPRVVYAHNVTLPNGNPVAGLADPDTNTIKINLEYLLDACLKGSSDCLSMYLAVFGHELVHLVYKLPDGDPNFGANLTYVMRDALTYVMTEPYETSELIVKISKLMSEFKKNPNPWSSS
jgi:hypothetical protein